MATTIRPSTDHHLDRHWVFLCLGLNGGCQIISEVMTHNFYRQRKVLTWPYNLRVTVVLMDRRACLVQGVTAWLTARHIPDDERDSRQTDHRWTDVWTVIVCFWVKGLTMGLTDHWRSDGPSLLQSEGSFDLALMFKSDGGMDGPSGM
ncbi:hypothetical protein HAX54_035848 [Datura stramonium]|uniref:Uncharacterized protein n=1 Tax=Datura stramonium TaxID=4076 RepID=A0ABS8VJQ9_DATST|nr:hypothetical protein [Datura stramonium]